MKTIKDISLNNGYLPDLIKRFVKSYHNLNKPKIYGAQKFPAVLKLPYIGETPRVLKNKVKD